MKRLFGIVVTEYGVAANNRGESEGNITTLQKILWNKDIHTTVSAEAIRFALRYFWQLNGIPVNRVWDEEKNDHKWRDQKQKAWTAKDNAGEIYIDDDVLGFMLPNAASNDGSNKKGSCDKRRGVLEVTRAISLTPFVGDITFNARSGAKTNTSLYGSEVHATRYQYGFALTPTFLRKPEHALDTIDAIVALSGVGGNHSRFLYDFSPDSVVFRWTNDFSPRMLYGFAMEPNGIVTIPKLIEKVKAGDIQADELILGGTITKTLSLEEKDILKGATFCSGIVQAGEKIKEIMQNDLAS